MAIRLDTLYPVDFSPWIRFAGLLLASQFSVPGATHAFIHLRLLVAQSLLPSSGNEVYLVAWAATCWHALWQQRQPSDY